MDLAAKTILMFIMQMNYFGLDGIDIIDPNEVYCLATNIYHEARGEPLEGQIAVASVTINRVHDHRWPDTICEVVFQAQRDPETREPRLHRCQFSWYCDGEDREISFRQAYFREDVTEVRDIEMRAWIESVEIALLIELAVLKDNTEGSTHYYNSYLVSPHWARYYTPTVRYGRHVFYRREQGSLR